jgi:glycosyltransferase A (GT-A) superfamily protein (DUF2064 family)
MSERIIIFARLPVAGKVKTRLSRGVGAELAARLYKVIAENTFLVASQLGIPITVYCSEREEEDSITNWLASVGIEVWPYLRTTLVLAERSLIMIAFSWPRASL